MKIVTGQTMQLLDRRAIGEFGISGLTLMENAGRRCAEAILDEFGKGPEKRAVIVAGKGNNGGDGYVIARLLRKKGWHVVTFILSPRDEIREDARTNLDLLGDMRVIFCPEQGGLDRYAATLQKATVIVDAMLGTGLNSVVKGIYADAVGIINSSGRPVVAVDIPSGIDSATGAVLGCAIRADLTVTFALAKCGHMLYPGAEHSGRLMVADIGIPPELTEAAEGYEFLDGAALRPLMRRRDRNAHKGHAGHCLIVAGSPGKTGAAAMAANSAVRAGAGLVTLAVPASLNAILEVKTTEAMTSLLPETDPGYLAEGAAEAIGEAMTDKDAVALGPGVSRRPETSRLMHRLALATTLPLVIDADALNALAEDPDSLLRKKSARVILTPHPGEMARLAGKSVKEVESDRIGTARAFAEKYRVFLVLKGARTVIAAPDGRIAINGSGNPGMASGGMGDVLTGILAALLAQGYEPYAACRLGVFIHGRSADHVAAEKGEIGITATDVQERVPYVIKELTG
ncbi:MAG TPA: NAD(P)H-hydrate dehydratase [Geobacteraceae bacterium]|nr:NAD(P)H-hydrate dehydratase [Geobacteraceae bacterium]